MNSDLVALDALDDALQSVVHDADRVESVQKYVGFNIEDDVDFDTVVDTARLQGGAVFAYLAVVTDHTVFYQSISGEDEKPGLWADYVVASCLAERNNWHPDLEAYADVPEGMDLHIFGRPVTVDGQIIGSLCLVKDGAFGDEPGMPPLGERLSKLAELAASLFYLKESARTKVMSELDLTQANIRHALALKAGGIASWSWELGNREIECDDTFRSFFGLGERDTVKRDDVLSLIDPIDLERVRKFLKDDIGKEEDLMVEFRVPSTGRYMLAIGHVLERGSSNEPLKILGVSIDMTESKMSAAKTKLLLREANHRVKNMLAILQSLAGQTLRHSQSPEDFTKAFAGRLQALAASHGLLSDQEWEDIDLHALLKTQIMPYANHFAQQVSIDGPNFAIGADEAIALGMVVHELATNALRYGALSTGLGHVRIAIEVLPDEVRNGQKLHIRWQETGGPVPTNFERRGFGSILIQNGMSKVIGSEIDVNYETSGVVVDITMPIYE